MRKLTTKWIGVAACIGLTVAAGCSSTTATPATTSPANTQAAAASQDTTQEVTMYIFRGKENVPGAADGKGHDTAVPANFGVKVGVPVTVTVVNYDEGAHTITAPDLNLNPVIKGGTEFTTPPAGASGAELLNMVVPATTTFTFTPTKTGVFRWHCAVPCDAGQGGWAMNTTPAGTGEDGFMAGYIVVV
jgi:plastocyanin